MGIFINFPFVEAVGNVIIKIVIISVISYYLYDTWLREGGKAEQLSEVVKVEQESPLDEDVSAEDVVIEEEEVDFGLLGGINKKQFELLQKQFSAFIKLLLPQNGYLCYKNNQNEVFLLQDKLIEGFVETEDVIPIELISLIEQKNDILVENKLDDDSSLLPFYNGTEYQAKSVLGIKTKLAESEALYWIFDADSNGYFDRQQLPAVEALSENARRLLAAESMVSKFAVENEKIISNFNLAIELHEAVSVEDKIDKIVNKIIQEYEAAKLTVSLLKDMNIVSELAVVKRAVGLKDGFEDGFEYAINEGLNGWVVMKNRAYLIDNIDKGDHFIPRFSLEEKTNYGISSYLAVPIPYKSRAVGVLTIEHTEENKYNSNDKDKMIAYCDILAKAIEKDVITEIGGINNG
jgi:hypothetical protein